MRSTPIPPTTGYVYLDIENPYVAWETYRGFLISAAASQIDGVQPLSLMFAGLLRRRDNLRIANELALEYVRANEFGGLSSRMTGMYFFDSIEAARRAESWRADQGAHFDPMYLAEVQLQPVGPVTRVDSDWITSHIIGATEQIGAGEDWIRRYWRGEPMSADPHWELIIDGRAVIFGTNLRQNAYDQLRGSSPEILGTLELGRLAAWLDSDLGHVVPWATRNSDDEFNLGYIMNFRDAENQEFCDRLGSYLREHRDSGQIHWRDLNADPDRWVMPDLKPWFSTFRVEAGIRDGFPYLTIT